MRKALTVFAVMIVMLIGVATASSAARNYLILAKTMGRGSTDLDNAVSLAGGTITNRILAIGVVAAASDNPQFLEMITADHRVQQAAEDIEVPWIENELFVETDMSDLEPAGVNTEPLFGYQWNLRQIHTDDAAAAGYMGWGTKRARVAVLDSGIWSQHPDIAPNLNLILSKSFVPDEPGIDPIVFGFNHGTHVAGIIAAPINDHGVQGVAPATEIVVVKVMRSDAGVGSFSWLIQGIIYAAENSADIINMSLGATFDRINQGGGGAGPLIAALNRAINHATAAGVLCVSSAGNDGVDLNSRIWSIPAQSGNGIAVAATGPYDRPASYTNYGQSVVDFAAPGGDINIMPDDLILSPAGYDGSSWLYFFAAGTSMAAAHVSGVAALVVGKYGKMRPARLVAIIQGTADDILRTGADPYSGHGRINAWRAVQE